MRTWTLLLFSILFAAPTDAWLLFPNHLDGSLSHLVSSPECYADQLNRRMLQARLQDCRASEDRQKLVASYHYQHGKHPFVCSRCWTYRPICICNELEVYTEIPFHQIVVWTHHKEWGSPSNTGALLPRMLPNTKLWLKDYHDREIEDLLKSRNIVPVILWPDHNEPPPGRDYWLWSKDEGQSSKLWEFPLEPTSIVLIARRQRKETLCTAEAVVAACRAMEAGSHTHQWDSLLEAIESKVDATRRYQGRALRESPRRTD